MIYHHYLMHFRRRFLHAYRRSSVMLNILLGNCSLNRCNPSVQHCSLETGIAGTVIVWFSKKKTQDFS